MVVHGKRYSIICSAKYQVSHRGGAGLRKHAKTDTFLNKFFSRYIFIILQMYAQINTP